MWKTRSIEPELIDLGPNYYSLKEYTHCLYTLDRIGRWLGGDAGTFAALDRISVEPSSILDVGCGGGIFTARLAQKYPQAKVVGIDLNQHAIEFAKQRFKNYPANLSFENREQGKLEESLKSYDVVLSTLVCHHLSDEEIVDFIQRAVRVARKRVIFNDLHRDPFAYYLFKLVGPVFFRNRLVQHDGPLSVLRAFKREEWVQYLELAGIPPSDYRIKWQFPFRWMVEINCDRSSQW